MTEEEIVWESANGLRERITLGKLTSRDVAEAFLGRIDRLDPALQAYSVVFAERVRASADRRDQARAAGEAPGALEGMAVAVKDLCDVEGEPTRAGTIVLGDVPAMENAEVVDRLEAAGALVLGKVKMTEGAFVEHHPSVVPPVNPWNPARWTGISSSGSGVAAAAGLCTIALGTDTGGSIRYPSSANGLSGLKPTHGRVSLRGVYPLADSLDHIGPMARSVEDVARSFSALCGHDPRDPWSLTDNPAFPEWSGDSDVKGRVVGIDAAFCEEDVDPEMAAATFAAVDVLRAQGIRVVEMKLPDCGEALGAWLHLGSAEIANAHADTHPSRASDYGEGLSATIQLGQSVSGRDVASAWRHRIAFARRLAGVFVGGAPGCPTEAPNGLDAIISPVIPGRFPANANLGDPGALPHGRAAMRFTSPFNLSGSPSLTLCGGFDGEGTPIGFQFVGAHNDEATLCALGAAYQRATDHHLKRPPI